MMLLGYNANTLAEIKEELDKIKEVLEITKEETEEVEERGDEKGETTIDTKKYILKAKEND